MSGSRSRSRSPRRNGSKGMGSRLQRHSNSRSNSRSRSPQRREKNKSGSNKNKSRSRSRGWKKKSKKKKEKESSKSKKKKSKKRKKSRSKSRSRSSSRDRGRRGRSKSRSRGRGRRDSRSHSRSRGRGRRDRRSHSRDEERRRRRDKINSRQRSRDRGGRRSRRRKSETSRDRDASSSKGAFGPDGWAPVDMTSLPTTSQPMVFGATDKDGDGLDVQSLGSLYRGRVEVQLRLEAGLSTGALLGTELRRLQEMEALRKEYKAACETAFGWRAPPKESFNRWLFERSTAISCAMEAASAGGGGVRRDPILPQRVAPFTGVSMLREVVEDLPLKIMPPLRFVTTKEGAAAHLRSFCTGIKALLRRHGEEELVEAAAQVHKTTHKWEAEAAAAERGEEKEKGGEGGHAFDEAGARLRVAGWRRTLLERVDAAEEARGACGAVAMAEAGKLKECVAAVRRVREACGPALEGLFGPLAQRVCLRMTFLADQAASRVAAHVAQQTREAAAAAAGAAVAGPATSTFAGDNEEGDDGEENGVGLVRVREGAGGSEGVTRVEGLGRSFFLNTLHYRKLKILHTLHATHLSTPITHTPNDNAPATTLPRSLAATSDAAAATGVDSSPSSVCPVVPQQQQKQQQQQQQQQRGLGVCLWRLLCRYACLFGTGRFEGAGHQGALPRHFFAALHERFQVATECFASPLNCEFPHFCSAFFDVDSPFGSLGSFLELSFAQGAFEANPPFTEEVMDGMTERIVSSCARSPFPLCFIVVVPHWTDPPSPAMQRLEASGFVRQQRQVAAGRHSYVCGFQHKETEHKRNYTSVHPSSVYLILNAAGLERWRGAERSFGKAVDVWDS